VKGAEGEGESERKRDRNRKKERMSKWGEENKVMECVLLSFIMFLHNTSHFYVLFVLPKRKNRPNFGLKKHRWSGWKIAQNFKQFRVT
jgi:hypothetical protein